MFRKGCTNTYLRPVSYIFLFVSLAITMVSFCTSSWYSKINEKGIKVFKGIWNVCEGKQDWPAYCHFLPEPPTPDNPHDDPFFDISSEELTGVRVLISMAILFMVGALGYPPFFKQMSTGILKIGLMSVLSGIAGSCLFTAMLIMTHQMNSMDPIPNFGYSYIMGWVSTGMCFVTACLIYIASKDNVYVEGLY
ncbi:uncharacterized protein [Clytia hemisphaerica]|uniref:uncharacterized protein n=1 Tax=Clytia hemisphaerica TaxID=252671 RepID=UPI0034D43C0C